MGMLFGSKPAKRARIKRRTNTAGLLKGLVLACLLGAILAGFAFLERFVKEQKAVVFGGRTIELVGDIPEWVGQEIKNRVYAAATAQAGSGDNESTAASVQRNIVRMVPWLANVKVQTTYNSIRITGRWRKPIAVVTAGKKKFLLDTDLVVLDYIPMGNAPIVTVSGLEFSGKPIVLGEVWQGDDLAAALAVLARLERMDVAVTPDKPLMREIDRIDVSNFNGRKNKNEPHIVLYTKGGTQILWGAEIGTWQRYLESPDDDKLAKLYTYYQQYGTLSGVKYINLRDPRQTIYLPIDKY